jgi:hypothetical protein
MAELIQIILALGIGFGLLVMVGVSIAKFFKERCPECGIYFRHLRPRRLERVLYTDLYRFECRKCGYIFERRTQNLKSILANILEGLGG